MQRRIEVIRKRLENRDKERLPYDLVDEAWADYGAHSLLDISERFHIALVRAQLEGDEGFLYYIIDCGPPGGVANLDFFWEDVGFPDDPDLLDLMADVYAVALFVEGFNPILDRTTTRGAESGKLLDVIRFDFLNWDGPNPWRIEVRRQNVWLFSGRWSPPIPDIKIPHADPESITKVMEWAKAMGARAPESWRQE